MNQAQSTGIDMSPARPKAPLRKEWTTEEAIAEINRLRNEMTPKEIERVQACLDRIRNSLPTERKYLVNELVWPWLACSKQHVGYRFRFHRKDGSLSGFRCLQCNANRKKSKPKKKRKQLTTRVLTKRDNKVLGAIMFGVDNLLARGQR